MSISNPSFPDVPFGMGVPVVQRSVAAAVGSTINSAANVVIGAAQQAVNGIISNVQQGALGSPINGAFGEAPTAMTGDSPGVTSAATQSGQWGIFDQSGNLVIEPDSFVDLEYTQTWRLPNYPMEQGSFQSYNKVQTPFDVRVTVAKGGSNGDRIAFLSSIDTAANSLDLYNVNTPDWSYSNVSIEHYNYKRTATNGVTLLKVELALLEIRVSASQTFTNTVTPSGADQVNAGTVQSNPVTSGTTATAGNIETGMESGQTLQGAISSNTQVATTIPLSSSIVASISNTVSPAVVGQIGILTTSVTPVSYSCAQQALGLSLVQ